MHNSQASRIGSCKWLSCSCQEGIVGENLNGLFYCDHCGHEINHHHPTNEHINNNIINNNASNSTTNNNTSPLFNRFNIQHQHVNNNYLYNQNLIRNSTPLDVIQST